MRFLAILFLLIPIVSFSQYLPGAKKITPRSGGTAASVQSFQENILRENEDEEGVALISAFYSAKDDIYDHKISEINSYPEDLSDREKAKRYLEESSDSESLSLLKKNRNEAQDKMQEYLQSTYPEYNQIVQRRDRKSKNSRRPRN